MGEIYASRVPKTKGKINLPLVATFMLEVRLKGYGEKGSQESSFQNRRGTQEMAPVHGEERRLSSVLRRKARPGDDGGKLFNVRGRRSAADQRQRRDSNGSRRFSIVP